MVSFNDQLRKTIIDMYNETVINDMKFILKQVMHIGILHNEIKNYD